MRFYRYLMIKSLKLLNMKKYDEFCCGLLFNLIGLLFALILSIKFVFLFSVCTCS